MEEIKATKAVQDTDNMIVIDDGRVDIPIRNQLGETIGTFRFNPTDINIVNRYNEAAEKIEKVVKPLIDYDISAKGEGETPQAITALNEAEDRLTEIMDYVFGGNTKEAFFSETHAFAPTNGKFFCEVIFDALGTFIEKKFAAETTKISTRLKMHTQGYKPGKRSKG